MNVSKPRLDHIDLNTNSRNTVSALIKLLTPYVPYSLHVLGAVLNASPRSSTLQEVDPSQISLWSTVPVHADADAVPTPNPSTLFSIIVYSHQNQQFRYFCSADACTSPDGDSPTEAEENHVRHVFGHLLDIARAGRPIYDSIMTASGAGSRPRVDTDPLMILVGGVHAKWASVLAPLSARQSPMVRYVCPPGALARPERLPRTDAGDDEVLEVSKIRAPDLPSVKSNTPFPRSDAYILSRAPYSVCLRADGGRPVAWVYAHFDGSIGGLGVVPEFRRQGLGKRLVRALAEKLDFGTGPGKPELDSEDYPDVGGGALGWNWVDAEDYNEDGHGFFGSLAGKENTWRCFWAHILQNNSNEQIVELSHRPLH